MICRPAEFLQPDGMPTEAMLRSVIAEHSAHIGRLRDLGKYYDGDTKINGKTRLPGQPCNKLAHPIARYIATITSGYLLGKPVSYDLPDDAGGDALNAIIGQYKRFSVSSVDSELARNAAVYGRGVEYVHADENANPRTTALPPEHAFVVYDDTYNMRPLFGVYYTPKRTETGAKSGVNIWVMTETEVVRYYAAAAASSRYEVGERLPHYFGGVPLIEYWNDESEIGDFERVIPLIDAYDTLQSDRLDDKDQFVDRLLVLLGCTLENDERGREPWRQLREDKALCLPDGSDVKYLYEAMDESGTEIVRTSILDDIHKLSFVPDISDKNFAANASGVAMRFKLFGLDQLMAIKEPWFAEALRERLRLFANFMAVRGFPALDVDAVKITFTRSMPANELERSQIIQNASGAGAMSTLEKVRALHEGDEWSAEDVEEEAQRIATEQSEAIPESLRGNILFGDTSWQEDEQDARDGE